LNILMFLQHFQKFSMLSWSIVARKNRSKVVLHRSLTKKSWTFHKGSHQRSD
jgi:hypothetical protein